MHPDGSIELTARAKDIIISGGKNIASVKAGKPPGAHSGVAGAAVVAVPGQRWGGRPVAFIATTRPAVTEQELTGVVRSRRAHAKGP